jgi:hypothetical protein
MIENTPIHALSQQKMNRNMFKGFKMIILKPCYWCEWKQVFTMLLFFYILHYSKATCGMRQQHYIMADISDIVVHNCMWSSYSYNHTKINFNMTLRSVTFTTGITSLSSANVISRNTHALLNKYIHEIYWSLQGTIFLP